MSKSFKLNFCQHNKIEPQSLNKNTWKQTYRLLSRLHIEIDIHFILKQSYIFHQTQ